MEVVTSQLMQFSLCLSRTPSKLNLNMIDMDLLSVRDVVKKNQESKNRVKDKVTKQASHSNVIDLVGEEDATIMLRKRKVIFQIVTMRESFPITNINN